MKLHQNLIAWSIRHPRTVMLAVAGLVVALGSQIQWVTGQMMQGCMMCGGMMGMGWQHDNGSYGMMFTFTTAGAAALVSVTPAPGAVDVDANTTVTIEFSHAMHRDIYAALHERDASGPVVGGSWEWSEDQTRLIFTPASPLKSQTQYTIHLGGGMMDANGNVIDLEQYGHDIGGQWVTEHMMGGGMMDGTHMGLGWHHANGTYGMFFTFGTQ